MNNECVICFEPVSKIDYHIVECECKYTVHTECISKWNEKCLMCNKPTKSGMTAVVIPNRREVILERMIICAALCVTICFLYIVTKTVRFSK